MIVLDRIAPGERRIAWTSADTDLPGADAVLEVEDRLRSFGVSRHERVTATSHGTIDHRWSTSAGCLSYGVTVGHDELSPSDGAFYLAAALAPVVWASIEDLLSVHLVLYELMVNIHDHGRALPDGDRTAEVELSITADSIEGVMVDGCQEFESRRLAEDDLAARVARRERRGYGMTLVRRALDDLDRSFGPRGNVFTFRKEIRS